MHHLTIPFRFAGNEELHLVPEEHRHFHYRLIPRATGQKVTNGRLHIEPVIDLSQYRAVALIDWVEIAFRTRGVHQALNINRSLRGLKDDKDKQISPYVTGPGRQKQCRGSHFKQYPGSHFIVRLQNPTPTLMRRVAAHLSEKYEIVPGDEGPFEITGIEISVDFYPSVSDVPTPAALALRRWTLSEVLHRHVVVDPAFLRERLEAPRVVFEHGSRVKTKWIVDDHSPLSQGLKDEVDGTSVAPADIAALHIPSHYHAPLDGTYYIGKQNGEVHLRLQDKTTDQRNTETHVELAPEERRSRVEICLCKKEAGAKGGPALIGLCGLDDLYGFRFERLRKARLHFEGVERAAFDFAIPTIAATANGSIPEIEAFRRSGTYGLDRYQRARERRAYARWERGLGDHPTPMGRKGHCLTYVELNERISTALRTLSRKWVRALPPALEPVRATAANRDPRSARLPMAEAPTHRLNLARSGASSSARGDLTRHCASGSEKVPAS